MLTKGDHEKTKEKMLTKMFALARIMTRTLRGIGGEKKQVGR
jgi:hypothetical protein